MFTRPILGISRGEGEGLGIFARYGRFWAGVNAGAYPGIMRGKDVKTRELGPAGRAEDGDDDDPFGGLCDLYGDRVGS